MPILPSRRTLLRSAGGLAGILATCKAPAFAQATPRKLQIAAVNPEPESGAIALAWYAKALTERSRGELDVTFHGGTLLNKEIDIMNAVKAGNVAIGNPGGASATVFPEMGVFLTGYLINSYDQAYKILNGPVGDQLDKTFQEKYGVKVLYFFDYGFRHFWNNRHPITVPKDLRGLKIRAQPSKVFADTVNSLGGVAVPMGWAEVITAAQQGVIDGADLPVVNMVPLKAYEVSKYYSMTAHNYGATLIAMNLRMFNDLTPTQQKLVLDAGREAQGVARKVTESVDTLATAKEQLEPRGMEVNQPDHAPFIDLARKKLWPQYEKQYSGLWEQIVATKV
ncbi:TRAP transporter substrate-binding protein [Rhodopila sp.]|jgi:tripartite ATP-independent transporter DctP family solute receptor|uniref:TRAP transporter substrate-binding protein n=1 Tax=Rhodopila sp. TaxID=2480087 RepID=UPI002C992627|nr:TRAP transporter substrate-binding protein [Rhodopila sp.]HVZ08290.1 TRAP transporter substrate-binding protein [Rhodopila sp.]